jgi:hypothetical protein
MFQTLLISFIFLFKFKKKKIDNPDNPWLGWPWPGGSIQGLFEYFIYIYIYIYEIPALQIIKL